MKLLRLCCKDIGIRKQNFPKQWFHLYNLFCSVSNSCNCYGVHCKPRYVVSTLSQKKTAVVETSTLHTKIFMPRAKKGRSALVRQNHAKANALQHSQNLILSKHMLIQFQSCLMSVGGLTKIKTTLRTEKCTPNPPLTYFSRRCKEEIR